MNIVFCGDRHIASAVAVAIRSISRALNEHDRESLRIHIVGIGWSHNDLSFVKNAVPTIEIDYRSAEQIQLPVIRKGRHVTEAAYLTLFLPELLSDLDKIIYLDHDVLVRDDRIKLLWDTELQSFPLAAAQAIFKPFIGSRGGIPNWRELGLDPQARMFNSGVMVLDLVQCRVEQLTKRALAYARRESKTSALADQQALNYAINGRWKMIDPVFNAGIRVLSDSDGAYSFLDRNKVDEALRNPCIVHFLGRMKPWDCRATGEFVEEWREVSCEVKWFPWKKKWCFKSNIKDKAKDYLSRLKSHLK